MLDEAAGSSLRIDGRRIFSTFLPALFNNALELQSVIILDVLSRQLR
jgi:hypothetical protein